MSDFIDRMNVERSELEDKLSKLMSFTASPAFLELGANHQALLIAQAGHMSAYLTVLEMRLRVTV